jgi:hypothetical protein
MSSQQEDPLWMVTSQKYPLIPPTATSSVDGGHIVKDDPKNERASAAERDRPARNCQQVKHAA